MAKYMREKGGDERKNKESALMRTRNKEQGTDE